MRTFDAAVRPLPFATSVVVPPLVYFGLIQFWAIAARHGELTVAELGVLLGLAQLLPLTALGWLLFSVAAYSIAPGKLIIHRVVRDRELSLAEASGPPRLRADAVELPFGRATVRIRTGDLRRCYAALEAATPPASAEGNSRAVRTGVRPASRPG